MIKLGYVSRSLPKDNKNHVILGTQAVKPKDFAMQVHSRRSRGMGRAAGTAREQLRVFASKLC
jgi:translation initiation factor 3 subunit D